jgi:hypothetical protein
MSIVSLVMGWSQRGALNATYRDEFRAGKDVIQARVMLNLEHRVELS